MALSINDTAPVLRQTQLKERSAYDWMAGPLDYSVLASQGLHASLHHREARVHGQIKPEFDKRASKVLQCPWTHLIDMLIGQTT